VVVVTSSLPWSSISPGSLSLRRPNSSASRTPADSTQSPVAFRTTGSYARAAPNYTQPPRLVGVLVGTVSLDTGAPEVVNCVIDHGWAPKAANLKRLN
jgi:hypothetical protein